MKYGVRKMDPMRTQFKNKLCPLVKNPFRDCYCINLSSNNINFAIHYCGNHYRTCEVFKKAFGATGRNEGVPNADKDIISL